MGMTGEQAYVLAKKYTEETAIGMGAIKGEKGDPGEKGFSPTITENAGNTDKIYKLDITTADSSFTTPNLKGADGQGGTGGSGEENTIESISVNGTPISPDENKNVNITVPDAYDDTALSNRVKTIEDDYAKSSDIPSLSGYATESYVTEQISNIPGVDLTDYATKTYVGEQITNAEHLKREIVTVLPSDTEASDNIIYMLKVESATGNDKYQEYMKIDGTVQLVGDTSVDLTDYAKIADIPTTVAELTDSADYAKIADIPTTLPANGGNADTVNNHTVKSDVPENAVFTDTIYDDTAVKGSIEELNESLSVIGKCKNLLNPTLKTSTLNGVTCTANGDGTYTLNGTASDKSVFYILYENTVNFEAGLYNFILLKNTSEFVNNTVALKFVKKGWIDLTFNNNILELTDNDILKTIWFSIEKGQTVNNIVIKPMITTDLTATYDDSVPYTGDGDTLTHDVAEIKNDLVGLSFSVSGTTLTITNGVNTWTLNANS